jgi:uncharacterized protein (DUF433 family)
MKFPTIRIEGNIISPELLEKVERADVNGQQPHNFGLENGKKVKDEIAATWADLQDLWRMFKRKSEGLRDNDSGNAEVRRFWLVPFLNLLGYEAQLANAEIVNNQSYAISHRDNKLNGFPIQIVGFKDKENEAPEKRSTLDIKPSNATRRMSPHALVQEYINLTEHVYALVSNGMQLRLLRDSSRLTKLSFVEFDLERMMEEEAYPDFAVLFRLLHVTRMPLHPEKTSESLIEQYHQDTLDSGSRIREGLSSAVKNCILRFANGFLLHPANNVLRDSLQNGSLSSNTFFQYQLRLIYRLLFLMVIEERNLVFPQDIDIKFKKLYYQFYSLNRLRKVAEKIYLRDAKHSDQFTLLLQIFRFYELGKYGKVLGIAPLGGDLFSPLALGEICASHLDNKTLMECLYELSVFRHKETGQRIRVNYASLNVEEFGSVYEGLLEYKAVVKHNINHQLEFTLVKGTERSSSGSHYTPDELVQPLLKHSLEYLIADKLKQPDAVNALLSLKVCDVACGSGHILLNAARRIALEVARNQFTEEQPSPGHMRWALREVIKKCIYGVDKNPLAVELCKVALWLEAHNPGEPLNFLDHHIKCGDAIIGLSHRSELEKGIPDEAFKTLPGDDKDLASTLLSKNKEERKIFERSKSTQLTTEYNEQQRAALAEYRNSYNAWQNLNEKTAEETERRQLAYEKLQQHPGHKLEQTLADAIVAQFFISKENENGDLFLTHGRYLQVLNGQNILQQKQKEKFESIATSKNYFHWFIEFPEVDIQGGFDCILGNPPYLGGQKISGTFGTRFLEYIKAQFAPIGAVDLVTYFFRRIFDIIKPGGFLSLISTNTIAQGKTREDGLDIIVKKGGTINYATKSMKWPGKAAVEVSIVTITKQKWNKRYYLNNAEVRNITTYLDDSETIGQPVTLKQNENKSFIGSYVLGLGFTLNPIDAENLIAKDARNKEVLFPYLNGEDLNNSPTQNPSRWVINFFNWPQRRYTSEEWAEKKQKEKENIYRRIQENKTTSFAPPEYEGKVASDFPDCFEILERHVKPERQRWKKDDNGMDIEGEYALRDPLPELWWIYGEKRPALYKTIAEFEKILIHTRVSKTHGFAYVPNGWIYSEATVVFSDNRFSILQSTIHEYWAWNYSSSLKGDRRYSASDCYETFPFPQNIHQSKYGDLQEIGDLYHNCREQIMLLLNIGLTKSANLFHSPNLDPNVISKVCKTNSDTSAQALELILKLRGLHAQLDLTVLNAYGWIDIELEHGFHEVDYLPENDRIRFTIRPGARKELLKRLLNLNHQIHDKELAESELVENKATALLKTRNKHKNKTQLLLHPNLENIMKPTNINSGIYSAPDVAYILNIERPVINKIFNGLFDAKYECVSQDPYSTKKLLRATFYGLIEIAVIIDLRKNRIPLVEILKARQWLKEKFNHLYPFATQDIINTIMKAGNKIIFDDNGNLLSLGGSNQLNFYFITEFCKKIDFDSNGLVTRLYPVANSKSIIMDPNVGGGRPCIAEGEIWVEMIKSTYKENNSVENTAKLWNISERLVNDAISFETFTLS